MELAKKGIVQSQESLIDAGVYVNNCMKNLWPEVMGVERRNLVDPASSHMLVSKIKPCMSQHKL